MTDAPPEPITRDEAFEAESRSPLANPTAWNAHVAAATADSPTPQPQIEVRDSSLHTLPVGHLTDSGTRVKTFQVRELNGEDEEAIGNVRVSGSQWRFLDVILERGVTHIGSAEATPEILRNLAVGDREYLAMAVSQATFGDTIDMGEIFCDKCETDFELELEIGEDIPVRPLEGPVEFTVSLRDGEATIAYPTGVLQEALGEAGSITTAQANTLILRHSVQSFTGSDGRTQWVEARPSIITDLSIRDRKTLLTALNEKVPGPRYDGVEVRHDVCGNLIGIPMGLVLMFPGL